MPFEKVDIKEKINKKLLEDKEFKIIYDETHDEYQIIKTLIKARKSAGLSQAKLAEKVGLHQQVISRIENDNNSPTLRNLLKIVRGLGLELTIKKQSDKWI